MSFLDDILKTKKKEIRSLRKRTPDPDVAPNCRDLKGALLDPRRTVRVIAEIKRASPSAGMIRPDLDIVETARAYQAAGAAAISVITDKRWFGGSLDILRQVRRVVSVPVLCKDFLIDPIQVDAARAAGADACLLIVAALPGDKLRYMLEHVYGLGMQALVEVHDAHEVERAVEAGSAIIGVNNRDLRTFDVDLTTAENLLPLIPDVRVRVAESGMHGPGDVTRMLRAGADGVLVGTALVKAGSPGEELRRWMAAC